MANYRSLAGILLTVVVAVVGLIPAKLLGVSSQATQMGQTEQTDKRLITASMSEHGDALVRLLHDGANPNVVDEAGRTPLIWAAISQSEVNIRTLLDAGADPCAQDVEGHTALWHSMRRTLHFTLPFSRGVHGTIFLRRIIRTPASRLLAAAMSNCTRR